MGSPDNFDYATQDVFNAVRHLRNHITELSDDESADAIACFEILTLLARIIEIMSPTNEDWPAKVIPLDAYRKRG